VFSSLYLQTHLKTTISTILLLFLISTQKWPPPYPSPSRSPTSPPCPTKPPALLAHATQNPFTYAPQSRKPISIKALSAPILTQDDLKKLAADKAMDYFKPDMVLGLGTESTTTFVVAKLGYLLQAGQLSNIV
jgi:ribose 5-phosphate isomerase A